MDEPIVLTPAEMQKMLNESVDTIANKVIEKVTPTITTHNEDMKKAIENEVNLQLVKSKANKNPFAGKQYVGLEDIPKDQHLLAKSILTTFETVSHQKGRMQLMDSNDMQRFATNKNATLEEVAKMLFPADNVIQKEMQVSIGSDGGLLVPQSIAPEVLPFLNDAPSIYNEIPTINMPTGAMTYIKEMTSPNVYFNGELENIVESTITLGDVILNSKQISCQIVLSNKLLRYNTIVNVEQMVKRAIMAKMIPTIEYYMIYGEGINNKFTGLKKIATDASNVTASAGTSIANIRTDLGRLKSKLRTANVQIENGIFLTAPSVADYLEAATASVSELAPFASEIQAGRLAGNKFYSTNTVNDTYLAGVLGGGTDSEMFFFDANKFVKGISRNMEIMVRPYGTYYDTAGVLQSGEAKDTTTITVLLEMDFAALYTQAVAMTSGVAYKY